ncbi:ATP-grasp domain-containing protein [Bacteroides bouchesdurhonensis]|uniref:ATP-grasp domain-containing protein n=1 Tax=Bacteroides bouchesdurhonensis TaxID=1841855 RepID=UPI0011DDA4BD|nr:ATP-grasp domain-containing protein [Bacteroides bouchesdurhonensis]
MKQKKLMLLGGLRYLLPVIEAAHKQGYHVITADYIPSNIAHKYSDEFCNVSVVDKKAVLAAAKQLEIDGIMSFAVDPGVVTASYVQEQLGLPAFGPFESVCILQNKDKFREFLTANGFNVPWAKGFGSLEDALAERYWYSWPCIVKPTDSAGSKGVTRVDKPEELEPALRHAFECSISGRVIVEEFLEKEGCSSDTDSFLQDGQLKFVSYSAQRFDMNAANPYTPSAYSWPSTFTVEQEAYLTSELQRLFTLLKMNTSVFNIETRIANGKPYIMEASPRGGGNRLADVLRYVTGIDMITACVRAAVGDTVEGIEQKSYDGHWAEVILHANNDGEFVGLETKEDLVQGEVIERDLWVAEGDKVEAFSGANNAIGTLVVRFDNADDLDAAMADINKWVKVIVK